jgi:hypothetical protein
LLRWPFPLPSQPWPGNSPLAMRRVCRRADPRPVLSRRARLRSSPA